MRIVITDSELLIEDAPDIGIPGIGTEDKIKLEFLHAFAWSLQRLNDELGMIAARPDAQQAIQAAKGSP